MNNHSAKLCLMTAGALACSIVLQASAAAADDAGLKFKGGIGVIPVSSVIDCPAAPAACVTGPPVTVNLNIVRGVAPAGQIWVIDKLDARVSANGSIKVEGKGLVLGRREQRRAATARSVRDRHPDLFSGGTLHAIQYVYGWRLALGRWGLQDQRHALPAPPEPVCQPPAPDPKCCEPCVVRNRDLPH
jgi:hypothetical protein